MKITATEVNDLRKSTGAGMMDCKKALVESKGDLDTAVDHLRKAGIAKAEKKSSRAANKINRRFNYLITKSSDLTSP